VVTDKVLPILTLILVARLSAELLLTEKNNEPEMKATRKVRQKVERATTQFVATVDGADKQGDDWFFILLERERERERDSLLSLGLSGMGIL